jgi:hypothetical protein
MPGNTGCGWFHNDHSLTCELANFPRLLVKVHSWFFSLWSQKEFSLSGAYFPFIEGCDVIVVVLRVHDLSGPLSSASLISAALVGTFVFLDFINKTTFTGFIPF